MFGMINPNTVTKILHLYDFVWFCIGWATTNNNHQDPPSRCPSCAAKAAGALIVYDITNRPWAVIRWSKKTTGLRRKAAIVVMGIRTSKKIKFSYLWFVWTRFTVVFWKQPWKLLHVCLSSLRNGYVSSSTPRVTSPRKGQWKSWWTVENWHFTGTRISQHDPWPAAQ